MSSFSFHPELFERRTEVMELLADIGLEWFSDYASVDIRHDDYGIEVCGVPDEASARRARAAIARALGWAYTRVFLKDHGSRDLGWKVVVCRDDPRSGGPRV